MHAAANPDLDDVRIYARTLAKHPDRVDEEYIKLAEDEFPGYPKKLALQLLEASK